MDAPLLGTKENAAEDRTTTDRFCAIKSAIN
jgi:hypothetical protein